MNLSNASSGKSLPAASNYPAQVAPDRPAPAPDFSRRPGPSSSAAATAQATPRKGQGSRKQHRNQRRPDLGDRMVHTPLDRDDAFAEMRAVRNPSSRRGQTSITHLLNYTAPRPIHGHNFHPRPHRRHPNAGSSYHSVDKSRYVHANYRFVVRPGVSYKGQATDADLNIDWANVLQVIASSESQSASCPICLSEPVAPRMARCGHIFCLPCLTRFMVTTTNEEEAKSGKISKWKKCPLCEDSVYMQEVRPVRFYSGQESSLPRPGDDVVLRLMARKANSTLALPREGGADVINSNDDVPWHFAANVLDYARIMKGTKEYMTEQYEEEIAALITQEKEDEDLFGQDGVWMQRAIKAVKSLLEDIDNLTDVAAATLAMNRVSGDPMSDSDFYFYSTPPHLYLSPLDIRILKTKYGSFSALPSSLLPTLEHISTGHVVDDALRKRAKYLGHLPHGCVISFLECDWTDIVPEVTLSTFASDIAKRRKRNMDKAAQEERERIEGERVEAAALHSSAGIPIPHQGIGEDGPPPMDISEFQPLNGASSTTPPEDRLGFNPLATMSTSPTGERTVWGTVAVPASPEMGPTTHAESRDDGWLNETEFQHNVELSMHLDAIQIAEQEGGSKPENGSSAGGGKKKKKQKITLMSTGGRRGF